MRIVDRRVPLQSRVETMTEACFHDEERRIIDRGFASCMWVQQRLGARADEQRQRIHPVQNRSVRLLECACDARRECVIARHESAF